MTTVDTTSLITGTSVEIEAGARILRGTLIPFDEPTVVGDPAPDGSGVIVVREVFDRDSIELPPTGSKRLIPLLIHHDPSRPIGRIERLWRDEHGLQIEARLVASRNDIEAIHEQAAHGVRAGLSAGFYANIAKDEWTPPARKGDVPTVRRRGARINEASICTIPAYSSARIKTIRNRTALQLESDKIMAEYRARKELEAAEAHRRQTKVLAQTQALLAETKAMLDRPAPPPPPPLLDPRLAEMKERADRMAAENDEAFARLLCSRDGGLMLDLMEPDERRMWKQRIAQLKWD